MPFKSKAQMRYLFRKRPDIARRWKRKYGIPKNLPERVKSRRRRNRRRSRESRRR